MLPSCDERGIRRRLQPGMALLLVGIGVLVVPAVQWVGQTADGFLASGAVAQEPSGETDAAKAAHAAQLMDRAMERVIAEGKHLTHDTGGTASTVEMGAAVALAVTQAA